MVWKTANYEESDGADLGKRFDVQVPVVVLAQMKDGRMDEWNRLDRVWALVDDEEAFAEYVEAEIRKMLAAPDHDSEGDAAEVPVPDDGFTVKWLDIENVRWRATTETVGGPGVVLRPPSGGHWVALVTPARGSTETP